MTMCNHVFFINSFLENALSGSLNGQVLCFLLRCLVLWMVKFFVFSAISLGALLRQNQPWLIFSDQCSCRRNTAISLSALLVAPKSVMVDFERSVLLQTQFTGEEESDEHKGWVAWMLVYFLQVLRRHWCVCHLVHYATNYYCVEQIVYALHTIDHGLCFVVFWEIVKNIVLHYIHIHHLIITWYAL